MVRTFEEIAADHLTFTSSTFVKGTSIGALKHGKREIDEIIKDIETGAGQWGKIIEYADLLGCLTDSANREGISMRELMNAWDCKLQINKGREWIDNGDGSYSHVKAVK